MAVIQPIGKIVNKQIMSASLKRMSDMGAKNGEGMFDVLEDNMNQYGLLTVLKLIKISLIKLFRIGPVTGPRSAVLDLGLRPIQLTSDL